MSGATQTDVAGVQAAGRVVAEALREMRRYVRPGVTTAELDAVAARVFARAGARSAPRLDYGFPGTTCISVDDEAVHGIPGPRRLREGDLVSLDVTAELHGFYADACVTVAVGRARAGGDALAQTARQALAAGMAAAHAGAPLHAIGAAIEAVVLRRGHSVCTALAGHGIGRAIHEEPTVLNHYVADDDEPLCAGTVLTIEPIVTTGDGEVEPTGDGWTLRTADGAPAAHAEHTLLITGGAPLVLTA
jgi:methionyl aminopeptidase